MVRLGVDRLAEYAPFFRGKRTALCAGAASVASDYRHTLHHVMKHCDLRLLLEPEHGLRGALQPGAEVCSRTDEETGLPCVSLFSGGFGGMGAGDVLSEALRNIDLVIFDMQDAGVRFFTYTSTLLDLLRACEKCNCGLCVLDRPNPIDGMHLEGPTCRTENLSFIGCAPLPIRHGFTLGEMAQYLMAEYRIRCQLQVIPLSGWQRTMTWEQTAVPMLPPSPNLPGMKSLRLYPGICLLAGTNLTEGRGTTEPFSLIGAPYIRDGQFARMLEQMNIPGLHFTEAWFLPQFSKYANTMCGGARIHITDPTALRSVDAGVRIIRLAQKMYPESFAFRPAGGDGRWHIDLSSGTDDLRRIDLSADEIICKWRTEAERFRPVWQKKLIYPLEV